MERHGHGDPDGDASRGQRQVPTPPSADDGRRRNPYGVRWVVGCPQSGKTTYALATASRIGRPIVAVDSAQVRQLNGLEGVAGLPELAQAVWGKDGRSVAYCPTDAADLDRLCRVVRAGKDVTLLVDEASFWLGTNSNPSGELLRILRSTQHCRINVLLTTQNLSSDIPQAALACATEVVVFRTFAPRTLERLRREWGVGPEMVNALPVGHFVRIQTGF